MRQFYVRKGGDIIKSLLVILKWFVGWKRRNDSIDDLDDKNFLPKEIWIGLQRMILGYIGMIDR